MKRFFNETLIAVSIAAAFALGTYNPLLGLGHEGEKAGLLLPARTEPAARLKPVEDTRPALWALAKREAAVRR